VQWQLLLVATTTIGIATGVLLLPEHNPVVIAKQAASLDKLSGGRFTLRVGIGWSRDEFNALGVPFERRGARTAEYVEAVRTLWRDDPATFHGEFVNFESIRVNPKPVRRRIPVIVGGNSDAAGRSRDDLKVSVGLREPIRADAPGLIAAGIDELVLVGTPPRNPVQAADWVRHLAAQLPASENARSITAERP